MRLSLLMKRLSISALLFLAFFFVPNPVSDTMIGTIKASEIETDEDASKIKLNVKSKSCVIDETYAIKVYRTSKSQKISFKSSDSSIVTVKKTDDKEAEIVANEIGEATITVTVKEGSKIVTSLKCAITVTPPAVSIKLIDGKIKLSAGDKVSLKKELKPSTTSEIPTYYSSNPNVVTVSSRGVITAIKKGTAYVTATIESGAADSCIIEVIAD